MKITETTRLRVEDFPKQRDWISPLLESYNSFLAQCIRLLNKGILFGDNVVGIEHDFDFTFQSQTATFPQSVGWPYDRFSPKHLFVTYASEEGTPIPAIASWKFTDTRLVQLTAVYKFSSAPAVADLTAGSDYKVRVRVEP
jgi:hypothetical protein